MRFARSGCSRRRAVSAMLVSRTPRRARHRQPLARYAISGSSRATRRSRWATTYSSSTCAGSSPEPSQELEMSDALDAAGFTHLAPMLGRAVWEAAPTDHRRWCSCSAFSTTAPRAGPSHSHRCATSTRTPSEWVTRIRPNVARWWTIRTPPSSPSRMRLGKVIAEMHLALAPGKPAPRWTRRR